MRTPNLKSKAQLCRIIMTVLSVMFLLIMTSGCGIFSTLTQTTREIADEANRSGQHLNKKVGIAAFGYGAFPMDFSLERSLQTSLIEEIRTECPEIELITQAATAEANLLVSLPRHASGKINSFQLSRKARKFGMNAIITSPPVDIREEIEEKGLLWFKNTHNYARLNASIDLYDTSTGTKLLGDSFIRNIEMDAASLEKIRRKQFSNEPALNEALLDISNEAAEKICDSVRVQRWSGYIISVQGNQVSISSGSNTGLIIGDTLDVYTSKETVKGVDNQEFYLSGEKIGEVRITSVTPDQAIAQIVNGKGISPDDLLIYKE